jgi:hypothetical protein
MDWTSDFCFECQKGRVSDRFVRLDFGMIRLMNDTVIADVAIGSK